MLEQVDSTARRVWWLEVLGLASIPAWIALIVWAGMEVGWWARLASMIHTM